MYFPVLKRVYTSSTFDTLPAAQNGIAAIRKLEHNVCAPAHAIFAAATTPQEAEQQVGTGGNAMKQRARDFSESPLGRTIILGLIVVAAEGLAALLIDLVKADLHVAITDAWLVRRSLVALFVLPAFYLVALRRVQHQQQRMQLLLQQQTIAATAFEAQEGIMIADANKVILRVNRAFTEITGYTAEEAVGQKTNLLKSGLHDKAFYGRMWSAIHREGTWHGEIWNKRKDGVIYPEKLTITAVKDSDGEVTNYIGMFADIAEAKAAEDKIQRLTHNDALTGLPNRTVLLDRLDHAFKAAQRTGQFGAVSTLGLDQFKLLNDTHGHQAGDQLLKKVGQRLVNGLRANDTVARYGGDEFVVVLENLADTEEEATLAAAEAAEKIRALVANTAASSRDDRVTTSLGIALFPVSDQDTSLEALRHADIALHHCKKAGRDQACHYQASMAKEMGEAFSLNRALRDALQRDEFVLYLQDKTDALGRVLGAEALLRWKHPERGMVPPDVFIPLAEESGAILPIGEWVLRQSCLLLAQAERDRPAEEYSVSVNVSPRQWRHPGFVRMVEAVLRETSAPAARLILEITERQFLGDADDSIAVMDALHTLGVRISLDDFGTGHSSLSYLRKLPLDELKIDKSFVQTAPDDPNHAVLIDAILMIARQLGLAVVAEGVETKTELDFLVARGCGCFQGYYFSRPRPAPTHPRVAA